MTEQFGELSALLTRERRQEPLLVGKMLGRHSVEEAETVIAEPNDAPAPVIGIGFSPDETPLLQAIEQACHHRARDAQPLRDAGG